MLVSALLFTDAFAQDAATSQSSLVSFAPLILICAIFYFLILRPQNKRYKAHQEMINSVTKGDQIVTTGGLIGKVVKVDSDDKTLHVSIAENTTVKVLRSGVASKVETEAVTAEKLDTKANTKNKKIANDN